MYEVFRDLIVKAKKSGNPATLLVGGVKVRTVAVNDNGVVAGEIVVHVRNAEEAKDVIASFPDESKS